MATLLPSIAILPPDPVASRLEATLARLPAQWTILVERRIGGEDGPYVRFVLLHPNIGVALVDLAPVDLTAARNALCAVLTQAGMSQLPIVRVTIAESEIDSVGHRLASAFAAAPPLAVADIHWRDMVVGLLLSAEDAPMAPLRSVEPECDTIDERGSPPCLNFGRVGTVVALAITVLGLELIFLPTDNSVPPRVSVPIAALPSASSVAWGALATPPHREIIHEKGDLNSKPLPPKRTKVAAGHHPCEEASARDSSCSQSWQ